MNSFSSKRFLLVGLYMSLSFLLLGSCAPRANYPADSELRREVTNLTTGLRRGMEAENVARIMKHISPEYSPGESELRVQIRGVFQKFTNVELEFYSVDFNRANGEVNLETSWNLRWRDTTDGNVERYTGRTTFRLRRGDSDGFEIISQRGDPLLGSKFAGSKPLNE